MSPSNINSFVGDLVQMAQAMERLPQVEADLAETARDLATANDTITRREASILDYKRQIEELQSKLQKAEGDRDDAELRFLEADERANRAVRFIRTAVDQLDQSQSELVPPAPVVTEPTPIPVPEAAKSIEPVPSYSAPIWGDPNAVPTEPVAAEPEQSVGVSEDRPSFDYSPSIDPSPVPGPYSGKRYMEVPGYITRQDWIDGGGTNEDYDWRP